MWCHDFATGLLVLALSVPAAQPPAEIKTPQAAVAAVKKALDANDLRALSDLTTNPAATTLRKLAEPFAKTRLAGERLDRALKDKPALAFNNPFAASLTPFADVHFELVEIGKEGNQTVARIRYGPRGASAPEEVVALVQEGPTWRVDPPQAVVKALRRLAASPARLDQYTQGLEKLADVLNALAGDIEKDQVKTREAALLRLAQLVEDAKLAELLGN
jgi:hypothetical protein